jgi:nucleoside-diphosphate-sugar epimerase
MRVAVTGGAGFIGHHLVAEMIAMGADATEPVVVLDNLRRAKRDTLAPWIEMGAVRFIEGDVRDAAAVTDALRGADVVFHLAAQANVMGSEGDPNYAFTTNVTGTHTVLQAAAEVGVRRVLLASSREVYGQPDALPVPETARLAPRNVYGASKAAGEMLARAAAGRGGLEVVALRLANVYGPGDSERVLPLWLNQAARGKELVIYGGKQVLDLVWVGDVVEAFLRAAGAPIAAFERTGAGTVQRESSGFFAALNVGTGQGTSIHTLAERVRATTGRDVPIRVAPARAAEVEQYVADVTLLRDTLNLVPAAPLAHLPVMGRQAVAAICCYPIEFSNGHGMAYISAGERSRARG